MSKLEGKVKYGIIARNCRLRGSAPPVSRAAEQTGISRAARSSVGDKLISTRDSHPGRMIAEVTAIAASPDNDRAARRAWRGHGENRRIASPGSLFFGLNASARLTSTGPNQGLRR
jgi:hypothetical protein